MGEYYMISLKNGKIWPVLPVHCSTRAITKPWYHIKQTFYCKGLVLKGLTALVINMRVLIRP